MASQATWSDNVPMIAAVGGACAAVGVAAGWVLARRNAGKPMPEWYREQMRSGMSPALFDYCVRVAVRKTRQHDAIAKYTDTLGRLSKMCISPDEGQFLETFAKTIGAKVAVEVGCFTGYGTLSLALGCTGRVFTLDVSDEHLGQARRHWDSAGVGGRIEHIKGPASSSMRLLRSHGTGDGAAAAIRAAMAAGPPPSVPTGGPGDGQVDLVFIDADKAGYPDYIEQAHGLLRKGGVCLVDNTLWSGRVISDLSDADTVAIRRLNESLHKDERWDIAMVPIADGVTILCKR